MLSVFENFIMGSFMRFKKLGQSKYLLIMCAIGIVVGMFLVKIYHSGFVEIKHGYIKSFEKLEKYMSLEAPRDHGNHTQQVILNTYMRSGSTFVGSVIGHRPDVFYFYEPFQDTLTWKYVKGTKLCAYNKTVCEEKPEVLTDGLDYIVDILTCRLIPHTSKLNPPIHTSKGLTGVEWRNSPHCTRYKISDNCTRLMENRCQKMNFRAIKLLRFSLEAIAPLLDKLPNLKLVHMFRDPRAIINSLIFTTWVKDLKIQQVNRIEDNAEALCERMYDDILTAFRLVKQYPDKVRILQYESIYMYKTSKQNDDIDKLLDFIGLAKPPDLKKLKMKQFDHSRSKSELFDTAFKYRDSLPFSTLDIIQKHCKESISLLGLRIFATEQEMKNTNLNTIVDRLPFSA